MAATEGSYRQQLSGLALTIEKATDRTPDLKQFHVFLDDELRGSFRKLPDAQKLFARLRDESGWQKPDAEKLSPEEQLIREREQHQRLAHMEYWSNSHKFRGGGRPKRK